MSEHGIHYCDEIDGNYHVWKNDEWFCVPGDHVWVREELAELFKVKT